MAERRPRRQRAGLGHCDKWEIPSLGSLGHAAPTPAWLGSREAIWQWGDLKAPLPSAHQVFRCHLDRGPGTAGPSGCLDPCGSHELCLEMKTPPPGYSSVWPRTPLAPPRTPSSMWGICSLGLGVLIKWGKVTSSPSQVGPALDGHSLPPTAPRQ